jgi:DNA-directed RNA polymerase specialized sigma24 family protein
VITTGFPVLHPEPEAVDALALVTKAIEAIGLLLAASLLRRPSLAITCFRAPGLEPDAEVEQSELLQSLQSAIAEALTPHQRRVLVALALNGVPIDVLAERLNTNRGALYKTLHARRKLRRHLQERGLALDNEEER